MEYYSQQLQLWLMFTSQAYKKSKIRVNFIKNYSNFSKIFKKIPKFQ